MADAALGYELRALRETPALSAPAVHDSAVLFSIAYGVSEAVTVLAVVWRVVAVLWQFWRPSAIRARRAMANAQKSK